MLGVVTFMESKLTAGSETRLQFPLLKVTQPPRARCSLLGSCQKRKYSTLTRHREAFTSSRRARRSKILMTWRKAWRARQQARGDRLQQSIRTAPPVPSLTAPRREISERPAAARAKEARSDGRARRAVAAGATTVKRGRDHAQSTTARGARPRRRGMSR